MSKKDNIEKVSKERFFTKKDYVYWIIFLIIIIVFLLVWKWDNEQQLTNQISLVGSVSSILLALVAIGYAFFQTQSNSHENKLMLNTLMKINDEINKLESVNNSLIKIKSDLINMKEESSLFQEKMQVDIGKLRKSLEDKSWIDDLDFESDKKDMVNFKETLKKEYDNHINKNLNRVFRIDNDIMAKILSHIGKISMGELIDENKILNDLKENGVNATEYEIFKELERLNKMGIIDLVVKENDPSKKVFAMKTSNIEPLKLSK